MKWPWRHPRWRIELKESRPNLIGPWTAVIIDRRHHTLWTVGGQTKDEAESKAMLYIGRLEADESRLVEVHFVEHGMKP